MSRRHFLVRCLGVTALPNVIARTRVLVVPASNFPRPKFHFGQEVIAPWEDDDGTCCNDRGLIIGAMHNSTTYEVPGWCYLLRWTYKPSQSWLIGKDDGNFIPEQDLKALTTELNQAREEA